MNVVPDLNLPEAHYCELEQRLVIGENRASLTKNGERSLNY